MLVDGSKVKYIANDNKDTETTTITNTEDKTVVTYSTVKDGRTTTLTNTAGEANVYTFDKNNNIKSITKDDKEVASYKYDGLEQLVRENDAVANKTYVYTYDKGGNIVSKKVYDYTTEDTISTEATDTITYKYEDSSWKDLLTSYDGQEITYDASGNPLQYRDGIRTSKTIGDKKTKYQLEGNDIVKETTGDDEIWYLYDESNQLYGLIINGTSYYYEKNLQGDIVGLFDKDGKEVVTYSYDAWGNVTKVTGDEELAKKNPFRYRSYYYDEELGMYYLQSRYYDAEVGRFINADDVNVMATMQSGIKGANLFEYCENNAVNGKDINGYLFLSFKKMFKIMVVILGFCPIGATLVYMGVRKLKIKIQLKWAAFSAKMAWANPVLGVMLGVVGWVTIGTLVTAIIDGLLQGKKGLSVTWKRIKRCIRYGINISPANR